MEVKEIKKEVTITFDRDDICYLRHLCLTVSGIKNESVFGKKCLTFTQELFEILNRKV